MLNRFLLLTVFCVLFAPRTVYSADLDDCRELFRSGKYAECIHQAAEAVKENKWGEDWHVLKARAELTVGRYADAAATVDSGLATRSYASSIRLRFAGREARLMTGDVEQARKFQQEIELLVEKSPWRYTDVEDLVTLGQAALNAGADARAVLEGFFEQARKRAPEHRLPYLAIGRLALEKHDFQLATVNFQEGLKLFPDDPDLHFGLVEALADSNAEAATLSLTKTLGKNPNHIPALLFKVDQLVDSEKYDEAHDWLERIGKINPHHPRLWAYRAVLAHLNNDSKGELAFRDKALATWKQNPEVDHLIGKKLSQKYRFAEGAEYQRRALAFDENYLPASAQLSQDLLRLGNEEEGWKLADAVHERDGYDVATFNLLELRDEIAKFRTLENDDFVLRMEAREAAVYGNRVLDLLGRAKKTLCKKYGLDLEHKITVEIFPDEDDFAVRTFGMPAVSGYLGVCFGKVITANSPASRGENPSNWQAVLWHEFCHVVTLEITRNKMPRWLSEGISVYEELQADPRWGQRMNPQYREMVLDGEVTPLSRLSSAFLAPRSSLHLQFAYYESALAVEFLVERFGLESLKNILRDLGSGLPVNVAIERHTDPLAKLDLDFAEFVKERAEKLAPGVDWTRPDFADLLNDDAGGLAGWIKKHPNNFYALTAYAERLIENEEWDRAIEPLQKLIELYPEYTGAQNAYEMLATVYRRKNEPFNEYATLAQYVAYDADAMSACLRLMELDRNGQSLQKILQASGSEEIVALTHAERAIAVNPLLPQPHRALAESAEKLGQFDKAIEAYRVLLAIGPADPAEIHYRLALLLQQQKDPAAKRHVLSALEQAPRFRAAHKLLLDINRSQPEKKVLSR